MNTAQMTGGSFSPKNASETGTAATDSVFSGLKRNALAVLGRFHIYSTPCIIAVECLPVGEPAFTGQGSTTE